MSTAAKAVIAATNYWASPIRVGTHQFARSFLELGWEVGYVSDPVSPFHLAGLRRADTRERFRAYLQGPRRVNGLVSFVPGTLISPRGPALPGLDPLARRWDRLTVPSIRRMLERNAMASPEILWIDSVIFKSLFLLKPARSVLRIADRASGFPRARPMFARWEEELAKSVDLVVYSAMSLEDHVASLAPAAMLHVPNGVDLDRFRSRRPEPLEYAAIPRPRVVYVGGLEPWFDFRQVDELTKRLPDVSFVLIGPEALARRCLTPRPNVYLLGRRPPGTIPGYLQHADVGLIPFDVVGHRELVDSVHPLKLYEYLAAGIPVVAARWRELELLDSPALLYGTGDEAVHHIESAIATGEPSGAKDWIQHADWSTRLASVLQTLGLESSRNAA